jgi:PhzF family phenazine biosynthesis protein
MLLKYPLWLVNAFTGKTFSGNPAGVCLVKDFPKKQIMQNIAFEMHWSETAFLKEMGVNKFHIRWFSPSDEAPICGHATLASAHFLFETNKIDGNFVSFFSLAGDLNVERKAEQDGPWYTMNFPAYSVKEVLNATTPEEEEELNILSKILTTTPFRVFRDRLIYIALFSDEASVKNFSPNLDLLKTMSCRALTITAKSDTPEVDFVSRYFAPKVGILEDPVCGSAHCRLIPIWAQILGKTELTANQLSSRGGVLKGKFLQDEGRVALSGQAKTVLKGELCWED